MPPLTDTELEYWRIAANNTLFKCNLSTQATTHKVVPIDSTFVTDKTNETISFSLMMDLVEYFNMRPHTRDGIIAGYGLQQTHLSKMIKKNYLKATK
ncbi:hypothetical protein NVP2275O_285 [Vibrio phage 2.275.O._10N.286.54.E11]|nr:hypothetical protein NVP2275O_285 [Vibrio phage 2.275.O._10N.286.54.E11]